MFIKSHPQIKKRIKIGMTHNANNYFLYLNTVKKIHVQVFTSNLFFSKRLKYHRLSQISFSFRFGYSSKVGLKVKCMSHDNFAFVNALSKKFTSLHDVINGRKTFCSEVIVQVEKIYAYRLTDWQVKCDVLSSNCEIGKKVFGAGQCIQSCSVKILGSRRFSRSRTSLGSDVVGAISAGRKYFSLYEDLNLSESEYFFCC